MEAGALVSENVLLSVKKQSTAENKRNDDSLQCTRERGVTLYFAFYIVCARVCKSDRKKERASNSLFLKTEHTLNSHKNLLNLHIL